MPETSQKPSSSLLFAILFGITCGIMLGGLWPDAGLSVAFIGDMFLKGLMALVVPLVMTSMVVGVSSLGDVRQLRGLGGKTVLFYLTTTALSVAVGLLLVVLIQPGTADRPEEQLALRGGLLLSTVDYQIVENQLTFPAGETPYRSYDHRYVITLLDQPTVQGVITQNSQNNKQAKIIVRSWQQGNQQTTLSVPQGKGIKIDLALADRVRGKEETISQVLQRVVVGMVPSNLFYSMAHNEVLPLIIFSLVLGAVLTTMGEQGRAVSKLFTDLNEVVMQIVHLLMLAAPVGIGALVAGRLGIAGGFSGFGPELAKLALYAGTVIVGLLIHGVITLPAILWLFGKRNPVLYAKNQAEALLTAFSTSSSSATLPLSLTCTVEKNKVSAKIADFVLPLGATVNMDGTALYEAVAAVFIAQMYGIQLGGVQMFVIFLTATLAAIGAAGIPEAGLVTMVIVLKAVNLPVEGISLILVIDWLLDRCRTTVNVWGDSIGAAVMDELHTK